VALANIHHHLLVRHIALRDPHVRRSLPVPQEETESNQMVKPFMNWKILFACFICFTIGVAIYFSIQLYLSGNLTLNTIIPWITTQSLAFFTTALAFFQNNLQTVISAVIGVPTAIVGAYKLIKNKVSGQINDVRQTAASQVNVMQGQVSEMGKTIKEQETQIGTLKTQVQEQTALTANFTELQTAYDAKVAEVQKLIAEKNAIQQSSLSQIVVKCRMCGTDYLKWQLNCPTCKTPQTVMA